MYPDGVKSRRRAEGAKVTHRWLHRPLALSEQPRGVTDLANELKFTKSNVHRLLATLQSQGFVRQILPHSTYELTTKIWVLGTHVIHRMALLRSRVLRWRSSPK